MVFDKVMMKWVKNTLQATRGSSDMVDYLPAEEEEVSEDPFGDIESLRDDTNHVSSQQDDSRDEERRLELSHVVEQTEFDDEEEMELTSFETDDPSGRVVEVMTGYDSDDDETIDSEDNPNDAVEEVSVPEIGFDSEDELNHSVESASPEITPVPPPLPSSLSVASIPAVLATPLRGAPSATPIRSALKSHSVTPTSVMKTTSQRYRTPMRKMGHRRSVSFSDGKREGPIRGLTRVAVGEMPADRSAAGTSNVPSVRSKRIADMMTALEDSGMFVPRKFHPVLNEKIQIPGKNLPRRPLAPEGDQTKSSLWVAGDLTRVLLVHLNLRGVEESSLGHRPINLRLLDQAAAPTQLS